MFFKMKKILKESIKNNTYQIEDNHEEAINNKTYQIYEDVSKKLNDIYIMKQWLFAKLQELRTFPNLQSRYKI